MKLIPSQTIVMVSSNVTPEAMRDKMFDTYLNTQTEFSDIIEVEIEFNNCDRVALFNIDADSIDFELTDDDTSSVVQTKTVATNGSEWVVEDIYIYANATLKISMNKTGGTVKCGLCGIGLSTDIGTVLYNPNLGFVDFSKKDTNEFGNTYLKVGSWAKQPRLRTYIPLSAMDSVFEDLVAARGSLSIFEGNEGDTNYESLRVFGFTRDWKIQTEPPNLAWIDYDIQGVI